MSPRSEAFRVLRLADGGCMQGTLMGMMPVPFERTSKDIRECLRGWLVHFVGPSAEVHRFFQTPVAAQDATRGRVVCFTWTQWEGFLIPPTNWQLPASRIFLR